MARKNLKRLRWNSLLALGRRARDSGHGNAGAFHCGLWKSRKGNFRTGGAGCSTGFYKNMPQESTITLFPDTGRVLTEEYCSEVDYSVETMTQWDFGNLQQVCSGLAKSTYNGPTMALGGCKSIFAESVGGGERDYLLDTLNIERKKMGLPDLVPVKPSHP
ncbi:MAG TPA: hypothetical protein VIG74_01430 [Alphaproteobacteria bacterium]